MTDEYDRSILPLVLCEDREALFLELRVAHRKDFIHEEYLSIGLNCYRERQTHGHAAREITKLLVRKVLQISKFENALDPLRYLTARQA